MASPKVSTNNLFWKKGRGRGFRPGGPFSPSRRPGEGQSQNSTDVQETTNEQPAPQERLQVSNPIMPQSGRKLMAKYNYSANEDSPLGVELSMKQGDYIFLVNKHSDNDQWWKVRDNDGNEGFVPAKYVVTSDEKQTELPWLANKRLEDEKKYSPDANPVFKPYVSAYNQPEQQGKAEKNVSEFYCQVCQKQLNGPQPFKAHMNSKAHKEEEELAKEYAAEGIERD